MGTSYDAMIVMGAPIKSCITYIDTSTMITKYNENTGKPYEVEVPGEVMKFNGKEIEEYEEVEELCRPLSIIHGAIYGEEVLLGTLLCNMDLNYECGITEIDPVKIGEAEIEVATAFEKFGIDLIPKLYLVGYVG